MSDQTVATLQLVKRKDSDSSDINTLDLLSLPTELQYQGWQQALPQSGASSVDEVVTLLMNAGNADTLATALQAIDSKIKETQWAQEPLNPIGVWLRSKLQGETNARQSFVLNINRPQAGLGITNPLAYNGIIPDYGLGITRMPVWENVLKQSITPGAITAHGGSISYTVAGDAHARVASITNSAQSGRTYNEIWMGAKGDRYGITAANFVPVWHLGFNGRVDADTTRELDSTALDGNKCVTTFATVTTMITRVAASLSSLSIANPSDQRGKYIALLRAKTSDASLVVNVRIGQGFRDSDNPAGYHSMAFLPRYPISNAATAWHYYTLGTVKIPAIDGFFEQSITSSALAIQAEKVSGTGNLEIDAIVLIPAEHSIHAILADSVYTNSIPLILLSRPDKRNYAIAYESGAGIIWGSAPPDVSNWSLPTGSGVIICATQGANNIKTDVFTPVLSVYPSYNSLRGSV